MRRSSTLQVIVLVAIAATMAVNAAANALPINNLTTGDIANRFDVFFLPAPYVFGIWGLIYLGLVLYGIYQVLPPQRNNARLAAIDVPFLISCAANIAWILVWHYEQFVVSILAMLVLLGALITLYLRLRSRPGRVPRAEFWTVCVPFSIYLGWITVATVANVTAVLDYVGWTGWGISPEAWFVIVSVVALAIALAVIWRRRDVAYGLVIPWAFAGIYARYPDAGIVSLTSLAVAAVALVAVVVIAFRQATEAPSPRST